MIRRKIASSVLHGNENEVNRGRAFKVMHSVIWHVYIYICIYIYIYLYMLYVCMFQVQLSVSTTFYLCMYVPGSAVSASHLLLVSSIHVRLAIALAHVVDAAGACLSCTCADGGRCGRVFPCSVFPLTFFLYL